jgi:hypothetical protein
MSQTDSSCVSENKIIRDDEMKQKEFSEDAPKELAENRSRNSFGKVNV